MIIECPRCHSFLSIDYRRCPNCHQPLAAPEWEHQRALARRRERLQVPFLVLLLLVMDAVLVGIAAVVVPHVVGLWRTHGAAPAILILVLTGVSLLTDQRTFSERLSGAEPNRAGVNRKVGDWKVGESCAIGGRDWADEGGAA